MYKKYDYYDYYFNKGLNVYLMFIFCLVKELYKY